VHVWESTRT
jgi:hypothetical protein